MVSILIVNWNTRDMLRKCLASIQTFPPSEPFEVIVVDNASSDGSAEMVESEFSPSRSGRGLGGGSAHGGARLRLIRSTTNTGYARGNNLAFAEASGEFLLTLNPDTEFVDASLDKAIHLMRVNPEVGCLGARQVTPDGSTQTSIRGFPTILGIIGDISGLGKRIPGGRLDSYRLTEFDYETEQDAPQPMGTFLLFRREALEAIQPSSSPADPPPVPSRNGRGRLCPFDERFPILFNEVDLLYRLHKKGWRTLYAPSVRILHHGGESTKQVRQIMIWESHRSLVRYLRKHQRSVFGWIGVSLLAPIIYAAAFVRAKGYHAGFQA